MSENICLPQTHLFIIISVFMGLCIWHIHNEKKKHLKEHNFKYNDHLLSKIVKTISELPEQIKQVKQDEQNNVVNQDNQVNLVNPNVKIIDPELEKHILLSKRDRAILSNDFAPPERRVPEYAYPDRYVKAQLNIATRGDPDNYQILGIVLRNNTETAYNLFGRQTYPGSNQYEYYVQGNMDGNIVKIPISIRGDKEINDGQVVQIPGTDQNKGVFKVKLYKLDVPRYNPFIL